MKMIYVFSVTIAGKDEEQVDSVAKYLVRDMNERDFGSVVVECVGVGSVEEVNDDRPITR